VLPSVFHCGDQKYGNVILFYLVDKSVFFLLPLKYLVLSTFKIRIFFCI
jgi:hypothetical protein